MGRNTGMREVTPGTVANCQNRCTWCVRVAFSEDLQNKRTPGCNSIAAIHLPLWPGEYVQLCKNG
eukprot:4639350-Amphidinium_carterae.1